MRYLSLEEFKARIAQLVHPGQSACVAKKTNPLLVRKPTDRGYNPPRMRDKTKRNHKK
jgi:hypothetical protein